MVIIWPSMTWMIWGSPWTWLMLPCQCSQVFLRKLRRWGSWYRFDGEEMALALCHHIAIILPSLCHEIWSNLRSCSCWKASGRTFESSWMHWHDCGRTADLSTNFTRPVFWTCHGWEEISDSEELDCLDDGSSSMPLSAAVEEMAPWLLLASQVQAQKSASWRSCLQIFRSSQVVPGRPRSSQVVPGRPRSSQVVPGPRPHRPRPLDGAKSVAPVKPSDSCRHMASL